MVDSLDQPAWVYQMLVRLKKIEGVAISTIILNTSKSTSGVRSKLNLRNINSLAYEVYRRFEKVISKPSPDAFASKNIKEILPDNIRILSIIPLQKGHIDIFNSKDISTIKSEGIDVLVRLTDTQAFRMSMPGSAPVLKKKSELKNPARGNPQQRKAEP